MGFVHTAQHSTAHRGDYASRPERKKELASRCKGMPRLSVCLSTTYSLLFLISPLCLCIEDAKHMTY